jgi:hypothetical protein
VRQALKTKVKQVARRDGAERLRQEADKVVYKITKKLAKLLEEKALAGNMTGIKTLVSLSDKKKALPEKARKERSPEDAAAEVIAYALGPQWDGNLDIWDEGRTVNRGRGTVKK